MEEICDRFDLLQNKNGIIRVPFLIKGKLLVPPKIGLNQLETAFGDIPASTKYISLSEAQVIRESVIDHTKMRYSGEYIYQVLPPVNGRELIETDIEKLANRLYELSVDDIIDYR